jgi:hypothetical protein
LLSAPLITSTEYFSINDCDGLLKLSLPAFTLSAGSTFINYNDALTEVILPELMLAGYSEFWGNSMLSTISLPKLTKVSSSAFFSYNALLKSIDLSELTSVSDIQISENPMLNIVTLSKLTSVAGFQIYFNAMLTEVVLPQFAETLFNFYLSQ